MDNPCTGMPPAKGSEGPGLPADGWHALGAPLQELQLDFCLPTGQSFRWRKTGDNEYTGVIGDRLVCLRQQPDDVLYRVLARGRDASPGDDAATLRDYFNLDMSLSTLAHGWAARCSRFRDVSPHFPGARMLRQDPLECLFQFICSSNNHISRIHGMVERLCSQYGTPLEPTAAPSAASPALTRPLAAAVLDEVTLAGQPQAEKRGGKAKPAAEAAAAAAAAGGGSELSYYAFPTLEQLIKATEEELRAAGFGYRARFIVGTTQALLAKPEGGRAWLLGLRQVDLAEALEALTELPGIGPKVAACICLFSLDKHAAIPVDTHVWQIAVRYYCPQLAGKSLTKRLHSEVQQAFVERFGRHAGWAHNTLFISELASQQHRLPEHLRQDKLAAATSRKAAAAAAAGGKRRDGGKARRRPHAVGRDDLTHEGLGGKGVSWPSDSSYYGDKGDTCGSASESEGGGNGRRGAGRAARQGGRKEAAVSKTAKKKELPSPVIFTASGGDSRPSSSQGVEAAALVAPCAAVSDGQADVGSGGAARATAGAATGAGARGGRRRGQVSEAEAAPGAGLQETKRKKKRASQSPPPRQAGASYGLGDFDSLAS